MNPVAINLRSAYLAGPMRGYTEYNFPAFRAASRWLRQMGWDIYSPAERDQDDVIAMRNHEKAREIDEWEESLPLDYYMEFDLAAVCRTDAVILLKDWEQSQGARLEARVAVELGHPVFRLSSENDDAYALFSVDPTEVNLVFLRGGELTEPSAGVDMSDKLESVGLEYKAALLGMNILDPGDSCDCAECQCASPAPGFEPTLNFDVAVDVDINQAEDQAAEATLIDEEKARVFRKNNNGPWEFWKELSPEDGCPDPWVSSSTGIQSDDDGVMRVSPGVTTGVVDTEEPKPWADGDDAPGLEDYSAVMRVFETGATRNVETDPDYHGFLSPLALHAYGDYMHRHRLQADGTMRDSDNWQKGIPNDAFVRSMVRHVHDVQLIHDGYGELARSDNRDDNVLLAHLAATLFNVQGMLHNVMKAIMEEEV